MEKDTRWVQRLSHFEQALSQLKRAVELAGSRELSDLEQQGTIQSFEYTHELAWNTMKDFLEGQGVKELYGSKDSSREAFKKGLIENGDIWMDMIKSRNLSSHTYNKDVASQIFNAVIDEYFQEFERFLIKFKAMAEK